MTKSTKKYETILKAIKSMTGLITFIINHKTGHC